MNAKRWVIGDIHGCLKTLRTLIKKLDLKQNDELYFLGDYIHRGPNSQGVIDYIQKLKSKINVTTLMGNHEHMEIKYLNGRKSYEKPKKVYKKYIKWMKNKKFDKSYEKLILRYNDIVINNLEFWSELKFYHEFEDYILVHGGFNFKSKKPFKDYYEMVWNRDCEVDLDITDGRPIIVGHTVNKIEDIKKSLNTNKIFLDGGCVYGARGNNEFGYLCALELNKKKLKIQEYLG